MLVNKVNIEETLGTLDLLRTTETPQKTTNLEAFVDFSMLVAVLKVMLVNRNICAQSARALIMLLTSAKDDVEFCAILHVIWNVSI